MRGLQWWREASLLGKKLPKLKNFVLFVVVVVLGL